MAEFPALPLWTDAYLGDTTHLNVTEHGAYLLLMVTAWRTATCSLPDNDKLLARYARCELRQWKKLRPIIEPFFTVTDGQWRQGRLTDEREACFERREKAAANGRASALKRKGRHSAKRKQSVNGARAEREPSENLTIDHSITPLSPLNEKPTKRPLPGDWEPEEFGVESECRAIIGGWTDKERHLQVERFRAHHEREGSRYANWQAAWKTWVINSVRFAERDEQRDRHHGSSGKSNDLVEIILAENARKATS